MAQEEVYKKETEKEKMIKKTLPIGLLLFSLGCGLWESTVKTFKEMTPRERATWMMEVYNSAYDDYLTAVENEPTDEMKAVLRQKKKIMRVVYPLIGAYSLMVDKGLLDKEVEDEVYGLLLQLLRLGDEL